jgi:hypothetical protein
MRSLDFGLMRVDTEFLFASRCPTHRYFPPHLVVSLPVPSSFFLVCSIPVLESLVT